MSGCKVDSLYWIRCVLVLYQCRPWLCAPKWWLVLGCLCCINLILSLPYLHHWLSSFNLSFVQIASRAYPYSITGGWIRAAISPCLTYKLPPSFGKQDVTHQPTTSIIISANQSVAYQAEWLAMLKLSSLQKDLMRVIALSHCGLATGGRCVPLRDRYAMVSPSLSPEGKNHDILNVHKTQI